RQALTNALVTTGAGNNPAIVRMFYRMARDLTEGGPVTGSPATSGKDPAALLYPKTGAQE
ncbi:MAG: hypothetical protein KGL35_23025, partial [Bradyrhizobium sp.]|nr:hypothetical protein [Bradyrhizobium sp.]